MRSWLGLVIILLSIVPPFGCASRHRIAPDAQETAPRSISQLIEQGISQAKAGDFEGAESTFRNALAQDPGSAATHNNLGLVLHRQGKYYQSAVQYSLASRLAPRSPEPVINLGRLYEESLRWYGQAAKQYEAALSLDQQNRDAMGRLAHLYAQQGLNNKRLVELLDSLSSRASDDWSHWALAECSPKEMFSDNSAE